MFSWRTILFSWRTQLLNGGSVDVAEEGCVLIVVVSNVGGDGVVAAVEGAAESVFKLLKICFIMMI